MDVDWGDALLLGAEEEAVFFEGVGVGGNALAHLVELRELLHLPLLEWLHELVDCLPYLGLDLEPLELREPFASLLFILLGLHHVIIIGDPNPL